MPLLGMVVLAGLETLAGELTAPNQQVPLNKPTSSGNDHAPPVFASRTNLPGRTDLPPLKPPGSW